jgi:hypothetical protein
MNHLTDYTEINGKTLTQPEKNLLAKLDAMGVVVLVTGTSATNQCTGVTMENLHPVVACLVRWIYQVYATYSESGRMNFRGTPVAISIFDRVKYLVLRLDNKAYSELVD